jgi:hypothetical protein
MSRSRRDAAPVDGSSVRSGAPDARAGFTGPSLPVGVGAADRSRISLLIGICPFEGKGLVLRVRPWWLAAVVVAYAAAAFARSGAFPCPSTRDGRRHEPVVEENL